MTKSAKIIIAILSLLVLANLVAIVLYFIKSPAHKASSPSIISVEKVIGDQGPIGLQGIQGAEGLQGALGPAGQPGVQGSTGVAGVVGPEGPVGPQGEPGAAAVPIEIRYNDTKKQIEWRYAGDMLWTTLVQACQLTDTCQ